MVENVVQIKNRMTINVNVSVQTLKNIIRAKKVIFGIFLQVAAKIVNI